MSGEWQPFAISEQDEAYDRFLRGLPITPEPPAPPEPNGSFHAYRAPSYRHQGFGQAPRVTGPECGCLTTEEHLSACARKAT
jgi:hypothetical protein